MRSAPESGFRIDRELLARPDDLAIKPLMRGLREQF
jgi:hypothetical protein